MSTPFHHGRVEPELGPARRRMMSNAPPLLTTSLNNAHSIQHGLSHQGSVSGSHQPPPMSATSLSSPFSLYSATPISSSPSAAAMAAMSPRSAYNPQEWAQRDPHQQQQQLQHLQQHHEQQQYPRTRQDSEVTVYAPRIRGPDEPVRSPPPPYSTNPIELSPADSTPSNQFSPAYLPSSASTCLSPACVSAQTSPRNAQHTHSPLPPPPPPPPPPPAQQQQQNSAIGTLQQNTQLAIDAVRAPAARRAASTGDMHRAQPARSPLTVYNEGQVQQQQQQQQQQRQSTRHGYALPPPPPGPPPRPTRSMSLNRAEETSYEVPTHTAPRTRRPPPALGTALDPVPPTPANWEESSNNDNDNNNNPEEAVEEFRRGPEALHIRTEGLSSPQTHEISPPSTTRIRQDSFSSLARSPAVRNRSVSALRERRSASRAGRVMSPEAMSPADEQLSHPLENLVLRDRASALANRRRSGRFTPNSAGSFQAIDAALGSARSPPQSGRSLGRTPLSARSNVIEHGAEQERLSATPNDDRTPHGQQQLGLSNGSLPRSGSPYVPRSPRSPRSQQVPSTPKSGRSAGRPVSHLLHTPNDDLDSKLRPISPQSAHSLIDLDDDDASAFLESHSENLFVAQSIERHRLFIEQEGAAETDAEKLQLFVQFITQESRLRRVRYGEVFESGNVQAADLVQDMFTLPPGARPPSQAISFSSRNAASLQGGDRRSSVSSSGTSFAESPLDRSRASTTATSDRPLKLDMGAVETVRRREGAFVPALSPIASMSAVTGRDEMESRGRPASRWWEEGSTGSATRGFDVMGRSKRESKYMSALLEDERAEQHDNNGGRGGAASSSVPPPQYDGPSEYPIEKGGGGGVFPPQASPGLVNGAARHRAPFENRPGVLDVSHFTTLPPPFPRRHPAVNNSHPELADTRAILRTLTDLHEADAAKDDFERQSSDRRSRANSWSKHQRSMHDQDMEFRISQRDITRQQYDDMTFALEDKIYNAKRGAIQGSFDLYQQIVVTPIHAFFSTRIAIANSTIDNLTSRLQEAGSRPLPDQPQTEGDSQPELLERLTLLKWLFEARESLHKAQFDIISRRNELYKELVLLPYGMPGTEGNPTHAAKKAEASSFFAKDLQEREQTAADESLARWAVLDETIRSAVEVGVQSQLSAFWDIAPQLQQLLQQIPSEVSTTQQQQLGKRPERWADDLPATTINQLEVLIPRHEVDENTIYWAHPLRYLYSVMGHAEASTRQFVDAQVSLWCLEQEVREGVARAQAREESIAHGGAGEDVQIAAAAAAAANERSGRSVQQGVDELKDKAGVVEGQWAEGLGAEFDRVKCAVREYLEMTSGWDEELEESVS